MLYELTPLGDAGDLLRAWKSGAFFHDSDGVIFTRQDVDIIAASGYDGILLKQGESLEWVPL